MTRKPRRPTWGEALLFVLTGRFLIAGAALLLHELQGHRARRIKATALSPRERFATYADRELAREREARRNSGPTAARA